MASGAPLTRKGGAVHPNKPANGTAGAAVTVTGTCNKAGAPVAFGWGANQWDAPATFTAGTSDQFGNCSLTTTYPAAGTWWLWMRRTDLAKEWEAVGTVTVS